MQIKTPFQRAEGAAIRPLDQLLAFGHVQQWMAVSAGQPVPITNLKFELEKADREQREVSWEVIDLVLNEGGPHATTANINDALAIEYADRTQAELALLRRFAAAVRTWFVIHYNGGTFYEALNSIMPTAPVYRADDILEELVPRSHKATGPRATRRLPGDVKYGGTPYEVYSDYELRVATARWSVSRNEPSSPTERMTVQLKQQRVAQLEAAMLELPVEVDKQGNETKLYIDKVDSLAVKRIKEMRDNGDTDPIKLLSTKFLDRLIQVRAGHLGIPGWQENMQPIEQYASFEDHLDKCLNLFSKSKQSVLNLMKSEYYFAVFATAPDKAFRTKKGNIDSNQNKQVLLNKAKAAGNQEDDNDAGSGNAASDDGDDGGAGSVANTRTALNPITPSSNASGSDNISRSIVNSGRQTTTGKNSKTGVKRTASQASLPSAGQTATPASDSRTGHSSFSQVHRAPVAPGNLRDAGASDYYNNNLNSPYGATPMRPIQGVSDPSMTTFPRENRKSSQNTNTHHSPAPYNQWQTQGYSQFYPYPQRQSPSHTPTPNYAGTHAPGYMGPAQQLDSRYDPNSRPSTNEQHGGLPPHRTQGGMMMANQPSYSQQPHLSSFSNSGTRQGGFGSNQFPGSNPQAHAQTMGSPSPFHQPSYTERRSIPSVGGQGVPQADMSLLDPELFSESVTLEPSTKKQKTA